MSNKLLLLLFGAQILHVELAMAENIKKAAACLVLFEEAGVR